MGEEMNQQLFYAPIGSDNKPILFDGKVEIEEFPVTETKHDWGLYGDTHNLRNGTEHCIHSAVAY